jgi:hypothetical protein
MKGENRHTIDRSFLVAEYRSQRLSLICGNVLNAEDIVIYIHT